MFIIFIFMEKINFWVAHRAAYKVAHWLAHGPGPRFCLHPIISARAR